MGAEGRYVCHLERRVLKSFRGLQGLFSHFNAQQVLVVL